MFSSPPSFPEAAIECRLLVTVESSSLSLLPEAKAAGLLLLLLEPELKDMIRWLASFLLSKSW